MSEITKLVIFDAAMLVIDIVMLILLIMFSRKDKKEMKYVRTKEELGIEREDGTCCFKNWVACFNSSLKEDWKYADTIEELCDEFVVVRENGEPMTVSLELAKEYAKCGITTYGAIWTDKGLIYVAKMNEKGELKLL